QELDVALAVRREALPPDPGREVDHAARVGPLDDALAADGQPGDGLDVAEDLAHGHAELGHERVERAHGRVHAVALDLRDEARRDADPARELAEADTAPLALLTEPAADLRRLELSRDGLAPTVTV